MRKQLLASSSCRPPFVGLLFSVLLVAGDLAVAGTTYYVSPSGDDASAGLDAAAPFATLAKAVATANADPAAETIVVLGDLALTAPVEIEGAYCLRGPDPSARSTTIKAQGVVSPLVKVSHPDAVVAHLTLSGGTATETSGGNLWLAGGGTVTNCVLRDAIGMNARGGGVWNDSGLVTHCVIEDNRIAKDAFGVGIYQTGKGAVSSRCIVRGNRFNSYNGRGCGIYTEDGLVTHCIVSNNIARDVMGHGGMGGGIFSRRSRIFNCLVVKNRGGQQGGGIYAEEKGNVVSNCTVVGNTARDQAAGVYCGYVESKFYNLIIWDNHTTFRKDEAYEDYYFNRYYVKEFNCLAPVPVGEAPVAGTPVFLDPAAGDYRLSPISAGIGAATDGGDLGCFDFDDVTLSVGLAPLPPKALPAGPCRFSVLACGGAGDISCRWRLDDLLAGAEGTWSGYGAETNRLEELRPGRYRIVVEAKDAAGATAVDTALFHVGAKTVYLVPAGTAGNGPVAPYDSKATAANDIHEALHYCADGTELVVSDGDYGVTREVVVPAKVLIRSENGPGKTSVYRVGERGKGSPSRVVRLCGNGATLSGFAVTNGYCQSMDDAIYGVNIVAYDGDTITNCILSGAVGPAAQFGAPSVAIMNGRLYGSVIRENRGGGGFGGAISIRGEKAHMADCFVTNLMNDVNYYTCGLGIWASGALIERCVVRDCRNNATGSGGQGGGVRLEDAEIRDSLVADNRSGKLGGAGISAKGDSRIVNCTIANNTSFTAAGLLVADAKQPVTVLNTLFAGNVSTAPSTSPGEPSWVNLDNGRCVVSNIAVPDEPARIGEGCVFMPAGAMFVDPEKGDYSLQVHSPCRDKGATGDRTPEEVDLAGKPRVVGEAIDIGAFEFQPSSVLTCNFSIENFRTVGEIPFGRAIADGGDTSALEYRWHILDVDRGTERWTMWSPEDITFFELPAARYAFTLEVRNQSGDLARAVDEKAYPFVGEKIFLVPPEKATGEPLYPYDSWERAATNLPMAVTAAGDGSSILAAAGDYALTEGVVIETRTRLESVEGPGKTSIYRAYPRAKDYPAFRPLTFTAAGSFLGGFTVSNSFIANPPFPGAAVHGQSMTISNCVFCYNSLSWSGLSGTVMSVNSHVTRCVFHDNEGGGWDGYGVCQQGDAARTDHCLFFNNRNDRSGQGYYCQGACVIDGGVLSHCVITNNFVEKGGKGGYCGGVTLKRGLVSNCLIAGNQGGSGAGGLKVFRGAVVNCTIVSNLAAGKQNARAGGIVIAGKFRNEIGITNCIVHGNVNETGDGSLGNDDDLALEEEANVILAHSLVGRWHEIDPDAIGCRTGDPGFRKPAARDWRLAFTSPCRDAGVLLEGMEKEVDLEGRPRILGRGGVDLGCYESDFAGTHTILLLR